MAFQPLTPEQQQFVGRLKQFLEEHDISQSELAKRLGIHPSAVNRWVNGRTMPDGRLLAALPRVLGANAHWLLHGVKRTMTSTERRLAILDGQREMLVKLRQRMLAVFEELDREIVKAMYDESPSPQDKE